MLLTDEEVDTICTSISMKPGHRKRFPALLQRARIQAEREEKIRQDQREREERMRQDQAEREEKMRQDQAEREERTRQENEDEATEAKAHERRLENARRRKELEAAETGAETQVATKEKVATSIVTSSSVAIAQTELPQGKLLGGIGLTISCVALLWLPT